VASRRAHSHTPSRPPVCRAACRSSALSRSPARRAASAAPKRAGTARALPAASASTSARSARRRVAVTSSRALNGRTAPRTASASGRCLPRCVTQPSAGILPRICSNSSRSCACSSRRWRKEHRPEKSQPAEARGSCNASFQSRRTTTCSAAARSGRVSLNWKGGTRAQSAGESAARPLDADRAAQGAAASRAARWAPLTR